MAMAKHDSPVPLYIQIKDYIRLNIQNGVFGVNERIPSERQLADQFNVNRLTVSKALNELAQEGMIYSRVGKGTYVSPAKFEQALQSLTSFTEDMLKRGKHASSRVLRAAVDPASAEVAKELSILPGAEVMVLHRLRLADDQLLALERSHIIYALCPNILDHHDFSQESLYRVLREDYGLHMTYALETIEAHVAGDAELVVLEADPCTPILSITRVTFDDHDQPIEYVRSSYRGDRYKFHTVLRTLD
jgi:GntR family transcriptional regulator